LEKTIEGFNILKLNLAELLPITVYAAIILFIIKECWEIVKAKRKSNKTKRTINILLKYEIELNFWSLKSFFKLVESLNEYKSLNEIKLSLSKGIESNYSVKIKELGGGFSGQSVPPFHFERFNSLLFQIGELGEETYEKIQTAYSTLRELDDYRTQALNLFAGNYEWLEFPEMTFNFLKGKAKEYDDYYQDLNFAYLCITGGQLKEFRLE
jgi:hypothetical protein